MEVKGATRAVHLIECRGGLLTRGRARQNGATPLYYAAGSGQPEMVQLLVQAGANMNTPNRVTEMRGLDVGSENGVCVSCWGLQHGR